MTLVRVRAQHHGAHRDPARVVQRRHGRALDAGRQLHRPSSTCSTAHVVVHQDVLPGDEDALDAPDQHVDLLASPARPCAGPAPPRTARIGSPKISSPACAQRRTGLDHVGDDVGHAEAHRGLHRAVEADHLGVDAVVGEVLSRPDRHSDVATRCPAKSFDAGGRPGRAGEPEGRAGRSPAPGSPRRRHRESSSRSRPVMPTSRRPDPTYTATSRGRRKKNSASLSGSGSTSSRLSRRCAVAALAQHARRPARPGNPCWARRFAARQASLAGCPQSRA